MSAAVAMDITESAPVPTANSGYPQAVTTVQVSAPSVVPIDDVLMEKYDEAELALNIAQPSESGALGSGAAPEAVQVAAALQTVPIDAILMGKYDEDQVIGEGVYGTVYKARDRQTNRTVAIKKLKIEEDFGQGVPANVIREVVCLRDFIHPNVVELIDVHIIGPAEYSLVFEFVECDLHKLLKSYRKAGTSMHMALAKKYCSELLAGIQACHIRLILHRDLKPQNVLIGRDCLKIGDFGLARAFSLPIRSYTIDVITLWYRCPEILLGCQKYGPEVDMWSAGCIIAEILTGQATFPGDSEIGTVFKIMKTCGSPCHETWPGCKDLGHWKPTFPKWPSTDLQSIFSLRPEMGSEGHELLRNLLVLNPTARLTARRAKNAAFVQLSPHPPALEQQMNPTFANGPPPKAAPSAAEREAAANSAVDDAGWARRNNEAEKPYGEQGGA